MRFEGIASNLFKFHIMPDSVWRWYRPTQHLNLLSSKPFKLFPKNQILRCVFLYDFTAMHSFSV